MELLNRSMVQPWHCDLMGHLTTRHYMGFFDDAVNILISRSTGWSLADPAWKNKGWADVRHEIDYVSEVSIGTIVEIFGEVQDYGRTSIKAMLEMRRNDEIVAKMALKTVFFDLEARESIPLTDAMTEGLPKKPNIFPM